MHANWCKETTTTTGTGNLTLSSVSGWPTFGNHFIDGQDCSYAILDSTGAPVEAGIGHYVASGTALARDYVTSKYVGTTLTEPGGTAANLGTDNTNSPWTVIATPVAQSLVAAMPGFVSVASTKYIFSECYAGFGAGNTSTLSSNTPSVTAFHMAYGREIKNFCVNITSTAGSAPPTNKITMGLYPVRGDGSVGPAIAISGSITPASTGVQKAAPTAGNILVPPGWYLLAIASDVAPTLSAYAAGSQADIYEPTPLGGSGLNSLGVCTAATVTSGQLVSALGTLAGGSSITAVFPPAGFLEAA